MQQRLLRSIAFGMFLGCCVACHAQNELGDIRFAVFGGPAYASASQKAPFEAGVSFDQSMYATKWNEVATGYLVEAGYLRPATTNAGTTFLSVDGMLSRYESGTGVGKQEVFMPFAVLGYSRLLNTANAINFGIGTDRAMTEDRFWIRAEIRDELSIAPVRNNLQFRLGFIFKGTLR